MRWPWQKDESALDADYLAEIITATVALGWPLLDSDPQRYLALTAAIVSEKRFEAAAGFVLEADMIVTIAANAAIPIMGLDMWAYKQVRAIIVHPTTTTSTGLRGGPSSSVVSDETMSIIGLASPYSGPVSLSWDAAQRESLAPHDGRNVVIHEFAHKIDMGDGDADGVPPLRGEALNDWEHVLVDEYERAKGRETDSALSAYAWTNRAEFFAVATEAFFCTPERLQAAKPELYHALAAFFRPRANDDLDT